jgi:dipeptidyl aminopeptidase/acylaminoacyl peptidase
VRDLTPFDGVQAQLLKVHRNRPHEAAVALNRDDPALHDLYRVDVRTGELAEVARNERFSTWIVDDDLEPAAAYRFREDGGLDVVARDGGAWRTVTSLPPEDFILALHAGALGLTPDGTALYLTATGANTGRLVRLELASGRQEVLAEDPTYDVGQVVINRSSHELELVAFERDRREWTACDPALKADLEALTGVQRGDLEYLGRDEADHTWVVAYTTDDGPRRFYRYDRTTRTAHPLFAERPELEAYELARMEPFAFTARDGLTVHGYLSFPPGADRKDLPTVLFVHGGPWGRDVWGFHPYAQFLANRGYLCVQVNFRGSTGYGRDFLDAGDREWAGAMHDDLVDAVEWVVEQGYADRERVAIAGGSYGGYAALVGATFTPEVFRCAVAVVAPSNLNTLLRSIPAYWAPLRKQFLERVGDPDTEEDFLWSRSPLSRIEDLSIPLLLLHGANDPRVKQAEYDQVVEALQRKGIPHTAIVFPDEGHGFKQPQNNLRFLAEMERFLAEHLGGRCLA